MKHACFPQFRRRTRQVKLGFMGYDPIEWIMIVYGFYDGITCFSMVVHVFVNNL